MDQTPDHRGPLAQPCKDLNAVGNGRERDESGKAPHDRIYGILELASKRAGCAYSFAA